MRVLVCGGRDYKDRASVWRVLDAMHENYGRLTVIQGGARGADRFALEWCLEKPPTVCLINEPADWETHGRAAGPIRNKKMLDDHKPDVVYAFPGGRGTANMIKQAEAAGVRVIRIPATPQGER